MKQPADLRGCGSIGVVVVGFVSGPSADAPHRPFLHRPLDPAHSFVEFRIRHHHPHPPGSRNQLQPRAGQRVDGAGARHRGHPEVGSDGHRPAPAGAELTTTSAAGCRPGRRTGARALPPHGPARGRPPVPAPEVRLDREIVAAPGGSRPHDVGGAFGPWRLPGGVAARRFGEQPPDAGVRPSLRGRSRHRRRDGAPSPFAQ